MAEETDVLDMKEFNRRALGLPEGWIAVETILRGYMTQFNPKQRVATFSVAKRDVPEGASNLITVTHFAHKGVEVSDKELAELPLAQNAWGTLVLAVNNDLNENAWFMVPCIKIRSIV